MADKTTGGPSKGKSHGGDQTAMPGAAGGKIPFGIQNPLSTGAPGSSGNTATPSDPTVVSPVPTSVFGAKTDDTDTGAPGGSGSKSGVSTGATYTQDSYGWSPRIDQTGGSVDTEAQANKYGTDTGIPGLKTPKGTGAQASPNPGYGGAADVTDGSERIH